jgi:hypothetical protein
MEPITYKYHFTDEINARFLQAIDSILRDRSKGKVTDKAIGETIGMASTNITRIRNSQDSLNKNSFTLEAVGRLLHFYKVSPTWLLTGQGEMMMFSNLESQVKSLKERISGLEKDMVRMEQNIELLSKKKK